MGILDTMLHGVRRCWYFLWHDESALSWIANIAVAFLLVRFMVYPLLGLMLGTSFPIVAVMSGSMEHTGAIETWWEDNCLQTIERNSEIVQTLRLNTTIAESYAPYGIAKENFLHYPFKNGFNTGDLIVLSRVRDVKRGDVIVFGIQQPIPIIHRVVNKSADGKYFKTKGDSPSNCDSHTFEKRVAREAIVGKALLRIPYLGWIKIIAVKSMKAFIGLLR